MLDDAKDAAALAATAAMVTAAASTELLAGSASPPEDRDEESLSLFHESAFGIPFEEMVRLEVRMEGLKAVPVLQFAPALRVLSLPSNAISSLAPLAACRAPLEEVNVSQNRIGPDL